MALRHAASVCSIGFWYVRHSFALTETPCLHLVEATVAGGKVSVVKVSHVGRLEVTLSFVERGSVRGHGRHLSRHWTVWCMVGLLSSNLFDGMILNEKT